MNKLKRRHPFRPTGAAACQFDRQRNFPRPCSPLHPRRPGLRFVPASSSRRSGQFEGPSQEAASALAFSASNSAGVMTPLSRRSASLANWSAVLVLEDVAVSWTYCLKACS